MRSYFPLTDYDFYAYVLVGFLALICADYAFVDGIWLIYDVRWTVIYGIGVVLTAYILGQVISMLAALILEKWIVCRRFGPPRDYLLGARKTIPKLVGLINGLSASHNSPALPTAIAKKAIQNAASALGQEYRAFLANDTHTEEVFQFGYSVGRGREDTCRRLDRDRREYEFSRNLAFLSFFSGPILLFWPSGAYAPWLGIIIIALSVFMFVRFVRYFTSFHTQVIREAAFAHIKGTVPA
jgi:hypothetical protein